MNHNWTPSKIIKMLNTNIFLVVVVVVVMLIKKDNKSYKMKTNNKIALIRTKNIGLSKKNSKIKGLIFKKMNKIFKI